MSETTGSKKEQKRSSTVRRPGEREPSLAPIFGTAHGKIIEGGHHAARSLEGTFTHRARSPATFSSQAGQKETVTLEGDLASEYDLSRIPTHTIQRRPSLSNRPYSQQVVSRPVDQVKSHLQSLPAQSQAGSSLYRSGIARFQRENSPADIRARRQLISPAPEGMISREDNKTCGPSDGLTFTSAGFGPTTKGAITVTPRAGGVYVDLESASFDTSATVKVSGGTDAKAKNWDAGFIQTATATRVIGHYKGSPEHDKRIFALPGARRDALEKRGAPWYDPDNSDGLGPRQYTRSNQEAEVDLHDRPILPFMWQTDDKKGKLTHTEGSMNFTAWLIARRRRGIHTIFFLNWATWEVDFGATFNYASTGDKSVKAITGKTTVTETGTGKGPGGYVLSGELAKDALSKGGLSKWD